MISILMIMLLIYTPISMDQAQMPDMGVDESIYTFYTDYYAEGDVLPHAYLVHDENLMFARNGQTFSVQFDPDSLLEIHDEHYIGWTINANITTPDQGLLEGRFNIGFQNLIMGINWSVELQTWKNIFTTINDGLEEPHYLKWNFYNDSESVVFVYQWRTDLFKYNFVRQYERSSGVILRDWKNGTREGFRHATNITRMGDIPDYPEGTEFFDTLWPPFETSSSSGSGSGLTSSSEPSNVDLSPSTPEVFLFFPNSVYFGILIVSYGIRNPRSRS